MKYLDEIELAECMSISECADWLAYGRLPTAEWIFDRQTEVSDHDARRDVGEIITAGGSPMKPFVYFDRAFLNIVMPDINPDDYYRNYDLCRGARPEVVRAEREQLGKLQEYLRAQSPQNEGDHEMFRRLDDEKDLKASVWLERVRAPLRRLLERAQTDVFQALYDGQIESLAVLAGTGSSSESTNPSPEVLQTVPRHLWVYSEIDWKRSNLNTPDISFLGVTVDTLRFLALFPIPRQTPIPVSGQLYGHSLLIDMPGSDTETAPSGRVRRRPPEAVEGLLKKAILKEFMSRYEAGSLPSKREAIIADAQLWVRNAIKVELSRTSAQRLLEPILQKMPKIPAQE